MSLSPHHQYLLYRVRLAEPIPIADSENYYTAELWLRKEGQDFKMSLVDNCFGLLAPPLWSANENIAIVNTAGSPNIACLHSVWLIDLEALTVNSLDSPWEDSYRVLDLSANGDELLVHSYTDGLNYLYNLGMNEQWTIPVADTDRMILIDRDQLPSCLVFDLEFSETTLRDQVWHCNPTTGEVTFLLTIEGIINQGVISPDHDFAAFVVDNDFPPVITYESVTPGIWLVALP
jgi:hypothetical protein